MDLFSVFAKNRIGKTSRMMSITTPAFYGTQNIQCTHPTGLRWKSNQFVRHLLDQSRRSLSLMNASSSVSLLLMLRLEWLLLLLSATLVALLSHIKWPTLLIQYSFASSSTLVSCSCFVVLTWQNNLSLLISPAYLLEACQISIQHGLIN